MALTDREKELAKSLKGQGYNSNEVAAYIGAERNGQQSSVHKELDQRDIHNDAVNQSAVNFANKLGGVGQFLLDDATDVFGRAIARTEAGAALTGTDVEASREFVEAPTGQELGGALLQTGAVVGGTAITGGSSLVGQIAAGAGLGYLYDIGTDMVAQNSFAETVTPGAGTIFGAAAPAGLNLIGRGIGTAGSRVFPAATPQVSRATRAATQPISEAVEGAVDSIPVTGVGERVSELGRRVPRAGRRVSEFVEEGAERAAIKENARPAVVRAVDEGMDLETIKFVENFDDVTRQAAREILDAADNPRGDISADSVAGNYVVEQYNLAVDQRKKVGKLIEGLSEGLPNQDVNILPTVRNLRITLANNGIKPVKGGQLVFENKSLTDPQQEVIQTLYTKATQDEVLTPKQIHELDQLFSRLQREARFRDQIEDVYVKVPAEDGGERVVNIHKLFRDVFSQKLDELDPRIKEANREYRTYRNLQDNVEATLIKQSKLDGLDVDLADTSSVALRRLFSNATSRSEYQAVYNSLDEVTRENLGYTGPRADDLAEFYLRDVKPLYPDTVRPTSIEGGIMGGIRNVLTGIADVGQPNVKDKQAALKGLLDLEDVVPPTTPVTPAVTPEQGTALQELSKRVNESSGSSVPEYLKDNKQAGFFAGGKIGSTVTPESVAKQMDDATFDAVSVMIDDIQTARTNPDVNRFLDDMKLSNASDEELLKFLKEATDEYERLNPTSLTPSATTKTTDLVEEAKGKTLDEFKQSQTVVYHGSNQPLEKFDESGAWFTDDMMNADGYGGGENLYEGFLDLKNPLVIDAKGRHHADLDTPYGTDTQEVVSRVEELGEYDGVIFKNVNDSFADDVDGYGQDTIFYPFNANKQFINESQLEDIWKQANK